MAEKENKRGVTGISASLSRNHVCQNFVVDSVAVVGPVVGGERHPVHAIAVGNVGDLDHPASISVKLPGFADDLQHNKHSNRTHCRTDTDSPHNNINWDRSSGLGCSSSSRRHGFVIKSMIGCNGRRVAESTSDDGILSMSDVRKVSSRTVTRLFRGDGTTLFNRDI